MADDGPSASQLGQWISTGASIVAPVTLLSALLFYFGYVSSSSEYAYFGVDVDTIGLSTQGFIMRSPQTLLVPLLVFPLAAAGFLTLNTAIRRRIASSAAHTTDEHIRHRVQRSRIFGLAVLTIGVILLFTYPYLHDWTWYALVTPLLVALGAGIIAYASRLLTYLQRMQEQQAPGTLASDRRNRARLANEDGSAVARRIASALIYVVIAASIFWATATIAQASGRAIAQNAANNFDKLPSVILDTKERLFLHDPGIEETVLPPSGGQTFHYRYRGLRLLIEGQDRMFLVPDQWSASDSTLIVPLDSSVRVQFQFQNDPP